MFNSEVVVHGIKFCNNHDVIIYGHSKIRYVPQIYPKILHCSFRSSCSVIIVWALKIDDG